MITGLAIGGETALPALRRGPLSRRRTSGESFGGPPAFCVRRPLDPWLPAGLAGAALLVMIVAYLNGASGLFHVVESAGGAGQTTLSDALGGAMVFLVRVLILAACGFGAIYLFARLIQSMRLVRLLDSFCS